VMVLTSHDTLGNTGLKTVFQDCCRERHSQKAHWKEDIA